jgi:hypothetical protein
MSTEPVIHMPQDLALPRGRLMFAVDATASREATWALARQLQGDMFRAAAPVGKLDVQLVFYRGQECRSSKWLTSGEQLADLMNKIDCVGGMTQIGRVFGHALREHEKAPVGALTVIADAFEENIEDVAPLASKLGMVGCPIFMFQDVLQGRDITARNAFRLFALKSGGAYFEFNPNTSRAVELLSEQLNAVARLAVGDANAVQNIGTTSQSSTVRRLRSV